MLFSVALASIAALAVTTSAAPDLELLLKGEPSVTDVDNFSVVTVITNTGDEQLKLYNDPRSSLSPFPESTFTIEGIDGSFVPFIGARVKYSYEHATAFTTLDPGQSIEVVHSLGQAYNFTSEGDYEVSASNKFHYQDANGGAVPIYASAPSPYSAKLFGSLISRRNLEKRNGFNGCSVEQQEIIDVAVTWTQSYIADAVSYLEGPSGPTPRYTTWFGAYTSSGWSTVQSHFLAIQSSDPSSYIYDCTCTDDLYAYVYSSEFGTVYLCNLFWSAPITGTDSKAGTIVHEASHFDRNGGTDDHAYGQADAMALAMSNPDDAIDNADNHEYFAENTPILA